MTLIKVQALDYSIAYAYAPLAREAVINTSCIVSAVLTETRRQEQCSFVRMTDGSTMTVIGTPADILDAQQVSCEHDIPEGEYCEACNQEYKRAELDPENNT